MRTVLSGLIAGACLCVLSGAVRANQVSPTDAAPFVGEWTLTLQGSMGAATFTMSIAVDKDKVVGEVAGDTLPKQAVSRIALADKSLVVSYAFDYQGMAVDTIVTLTPDKDGKVSAQMDFAGGAYVMTGTATKKAKEK